MKTRSQGLLLVHLAVLFFGFPGVIGKLLPLTPVQLTWFRVFLASLGLLAILIWQREKFNLRRGGDLWLILASGLLLGFHWTAFFRSVQVSTVAVGLLSYSTFPIFTVFLEPWLLRLKFRKSYLLLALACFLGVALMVPEFRLSNRIFLGVIWGILSGLSFSLLTIVNRVLSPRYSSLLVAFYQDGLAMIFLLPLFLSHPPSLDFGVRDLSLLLFLGLVCTAGAHTMFIRGLRFIEARLSSLLSSLEPVYGIIFGYLWLREIPDLRTIGGGLLILASVAIISWQSLDYKS
ncbi:MAG: DMT family transporter [Candidatus Aminicenantes bacterium]|nr:DMT family transporter [Candidatus Aminicenantes bacterium]